MAVANQTVRFLGRDLHGARTVLRISVWVVLLLRSITGCFPMSSLSFGVYRGRGARGAYFASSRRGAPRTSTYSTDLPSDKNIKENLTAIPLETLNIPYLTGTKTVRADIQNVEYIGSYNWIEAKEPTIIVPGRRPLSFPSTAALLA